MANKPKKPLLILGARTLAAEIADWASDVPGYRVTGFVDNEDRAKAGTEIDGLPVHWVGDVSGLAESHACVLGLMTTHRGRFSDQMAGLGFTFATIVHPTAHVSKKADLAPGAVVGPHAVIGAHARVGSHAFVNRGALIGHHTEIGALSSLGPGANVCASCEIGERVYIGAGATIIDHLGVGERSVVGAGALVTEDLGARVMAVGSPARVVRRNIDGK